MFPVINRIAKNLAALICFTIILCPLISRAAETEIYYQGDITLYPSPSPVTKVDVKSEIPKDEFAITAQSHSAPRESKSKAVKVILLNVMSQDLAEQNGYHRIIAALQWENIFPRIKVDKKKLEGKADRNMGAGGFFSGKGGKGKDNKGFIEKDVPYKVKKWGDHAVLLADGIAYPLDLGSAELKHGASPKRGMVLPREHSKREFRFSFLIPDNARNLAFHFFDFDNGHITIPLKGDIEKAKKSKQEKSKAPPIRTKQLESNIDGIDTIADYLGQKAPAGWQFKRVRLLGRSMSKRGGRGDIVQLNAQKDLWLQVREGFLYAPQKVNEKFLRFFPDYLSSTHVLFLVPESEKEVNLIVRAGAKTFSLPVGGKEKLALPKPGSSWRDGDVAQFVFLGNRH